MTTKQILLVESDPKQLRLLRVALEQDGYAVLPAEDGKVALEQLEQGGIDLVLSATSLPRLDGFELVEAMQDHDDWQSLPMLLMIDGDVRAARMRGVRLGVEEFLTKPVFVKEMLARVHVLLAKQVRERLSGGGANAKLSGSLEDMTVIDLLESLEKGKQSGSVSLESNGRNAVVYFRQGAIVDATLGRLRGEEAVFRLLTWTDGDYDVTLEPSARAEVVEMETRPMLELGFRQAAEFHRLAQRLPTLDTALAVDREKLEELLEEVPESIEALLALLDGERSILDVIDESPFDDRSTLRTLLQLFEEEVLVVVERPEPPRSFAMPSLRGARAPEEQEASRDERASARTGEVAAHDDGAGASDSTPHEESEDEDSQDEDSQDEDSQDEPVLSLTKLSASPSEDALDEPAPSDSSLADERSRDSGAGEDPEDHDESPVSDAPAATVRAGQGAPLVYRAGASTVDDADDGSTPSGDLPGTEQRSLSESGVSTEFFSSAPPAAPDEDVAEGEHERLSEFEQPVYLTREQLERRDKNRKVVMGVVGAVAAIGLFAAIGPKLFGSETAAAPSSARGTPRSAPTAVASATVAQAPAPPPPSATASAPPEPTASASAEAASASAVPEEDLPDVPDPLKAAMAKLDVGAYMEAIKLAKAAIKKDPENADGYFALFQAYDSVGKAAEASQAREACGANATKGQYKGYCPKKKR